MCHHGPCVCLEVHFRIEKEKRVIMDSLFDLPHDKGLFGEAVTSMQQARDLRKKKGKGMVRVGVGEIWLNVRRSFRIAREHAVSPALVIRTWPNM